MANPTPNHLKYAGLLGSPLAAALSLVMACEADAMTALRDEMAEEAAALDSDEFIVDEVVEEAAAAAALA